MGAPPIPPTPPGTDLTGKTAIVTGGNAGLGLEAARQYLTLKAARVIIAVRSPAKGKEAIAELKADPTVQKVNPNAVIEAFPLDLDDFQSGADFVRKVKNEVPELDILLNNGGTNVLKYHKSASGHERVMQGERAVRTSPLFSDRVFVMRAMLTQNNSQRLHPLPDIPRPPPTAYIHCRAS